MDFINIAQAASEAVQNATPIMEAATEAAPHAAEEGSNVIGTLGINWKLFIAQLINFGIVLFVLWRWVLTPVAKKLQARTERIEKSLQDAQDVEKNKLEFETWKKREMVGIRQTATDIVDQAKSEAGRVKEDLIAKTRLEQAEILKRSTEQLAAEKTKMLAEVKSEMASLVTAGLGKILGEHLESSVDKKLIDETLKKVS